MDLLHQNQNHQDQDPVQRQSEILKEQEMQLSSTASFDLKMSSKQIEVKEDILSSIPPPSTPPFSTSTPPKIPYTSPDWSSPPSHPDLFSFEILKNGVILESIQPTLNQSQWVLGRLPLCDIELEHQVKSIPIY